jgi:predicted ATP-grasp superfamily ATP-dependent carboligase
VTRQLIGQRWLGAEPFQYCGSVGPLPINATEQFRWEAIGRTLVESSAISGLFGVDAIVDASDSIWPVEVNPRYTASVEILERAFQFSALQLLMASEFGRKGGAGRPLPASGRQIRSLFGKAVVYAPCNLVVAEPLIDYLDRANRWAPDSLYADLPWPGQLIRAGQPILTVMAAGPDWQSTEYHLRRRVQWLLSYLR